MTRRIEENDMSIHDKRDSVGRAGLKSLMGDPRYFDGNHPEHDPERVLVDRNHLTGIILRSG